MTQFRDAELKHEKTLAIYRVLLFDKKVFMTIWSGFVDCRGVWQIVYSQFMIGLESLLISLTLYDYPLPDWSTNRGYSNNSNAEKHNFHLHTVFYGKNVRSIPSLFKSLFPRNVLVCHLCDIKKTKNYEKSYKFFIAVALLIFTPFHIKWKSGKWKFPALI